ncbi:MAG: deoxyribodipyrimidine photo-lyase [Arcticibacter sp.]
MSEKTILIWFRNDLRIHDNEMLTEAIVRGDNILPVYCFDPRYFGKTIYDTQRSGYLRTRFLLQSVASLRKGLQALGGDLLITAGHPEEVLPALCKQYHVSEVYHHREVGGQETSISELVESQLWKIKINLKHFIGHTLFHKEDLPFPIKNIPDDFLLFKRKIERESTVRQPFPSPEKINVPADIHWGDLPAEESLGVMKSGSLEETPIQGGEAEGLEALGEILSAHASTMKTDRSGRAGVELILSPWLSLGCLSPRKVYWTARERLPIKSELNTRIVNKLRWRDYNRFMLKKHGTEDEESPESLTPAERNRYNKWKSGNTGDLLVDACIRELNETGYISERCNMFLSSCLIRKMKVRWSAGYAYFEEKALNFSPALIWGNRALERGLFSCGKHENQKFEDIALDPQIKRRLEILHAG